VAPGMHRKPSLRALLAARLSGGDSSRAEVQLSLQWNYLKPIRHEAVALIIPALCKNRSLCSPSGEWSARTGTFRWPRLGTRPFALVVG